MTRGRGGLRTLERRSHELPEQRSWTLRTRLELGVVLGGEVERMNARIELNRLDEPLVRGGAGTDQPGRFKSLAEVVVDLVAMAVPLVHDGLAVQLADPCGGVKLDRIGAEPHRAAHVRDLLLLGEQVNHWDGRLRIELRRVRPVPARIL